MSRVPLSKDEAKKMKQQQRAGMSGEGVGGGGGPVRVCRVRGKQGSKCGSMRNVFLVNGVCQIHNLLAPA